jgi:hypothetical protein
MSKRKTGLVKALSDVEARIVEVKTFQAFLGKAGTIEDARSLADTMLGQLENTRTFLTKYDTSAAATTDAPKVRKPRKPKTVATEPAPITLDEASRIIGG